MLAENRAKPSAHAMEGDPQRAATHPEVVRDLFVQIGRITGQKRGERFEVIQVVTLDVFLAKGAQRRIEQRKRTTFLERFFRAEASRLFARVSLFGGRKIDRNVRGASTAFLSKRA